MCQFIDPLCSPAGKGLTSWLSFVISNWGIKHRFSEPLMPDISHSFFVFFYCVIVVINKQNKLKQKRSQNDVRLRRFESSFVICLIQREVILDNFVNETFGTAILFAQ